MKPEDKESTSIRTHLTISLIPPGLRSQIVLKVVCTRQIFMLAIYTCQLVNSLHHALRTTGTYYHGILLKIQHKNKRLIFRGKYLTLQWHAHSIPIYSIYV